MLKPVAAGLTAVFVTASSLAYAQAPSATTTTGGEQENTKLSAADLNALTDARIGIVKAALQLTPEAVALFRDEYSSPGAQGRRRSSNAGRRRER
jgi:hypothetical protein